jgi:ankyrin repeat protein
VTGDEAKGLLHEAATGGFQSLVDLMIERGVSVETQNSNGGSLLHSASAGGLGETVAQAIKLGMKVNNKDRYGWTPLHWAPSAAGGTATMTSVGLTPGSLINWNRKN